MAKSGAKKTKKSSTSSRISKKELALIKRFEEENGGSLNLEEMLRKNNADLDKKLNPQKSKKEEEEEEDEFDEEEMSYSDDDDKDDDDEENEDIDDENDDDDENIDEDEEYDDDNDDDDDEEEEEENQEDEEEQYKKGLEALEQTDPELYEYLKKHDPNVLEYDDDEEGEDDGEGEEEENDNEGNNDLMGTKFNLKKEDKDKIVTDELLDSLEARIYKSPRFVRKYLIIYRSACHINDDEDEDEEDIEEGVDEKSKKKKNTKKKGGKKKKGAKKVETVYKIPNSAIFDRVMTFCMTKMRSVFESLLDLAKKKEQQKNNDVIKQKNKSEKVSESKDKEPSSEDSVESYVSNKKLLAELEKNSHAWTTRVSSYAKSFLVNSVYFLEQLTEEEMKGNTLRMLEGYVPFILAFPALLRKFFTLVVKLWTSGSEATRLLAFSNIHEIAQLTRGKPFCDVVLRSTYLAYIRNSQFVTGPTLPLLQFLRNSITELFANVADEAAAYRTAFTYIRQLAIHLRSVVTHPEKDSLKAVHNWQFVNALRVWCDVLAAGAPRSEALAQLVYPVLQLLAGVVDYSQGAKNVAIRFHCLTMAQDLAEAAGCLQNPVPQLLQCLDIADMKKRPKATLAKRIDLATTLHVGNVHMGTPQLHEFIADNVYEILFRFLASCGYEVAFAELALPAMVFLRRFKKVCQNQSLMRKVGGLVDKIVENIAWMNGVRARAGLNPRDVVAVKEFVAKLREKGESPLAAAWLRYTQQKESMSKLNRKREAEELKRKREEDKKKKDDDDEDDEDSDLDEVDFENLKEEEYDDDEDEEEEEEDDDDEEEEEIVENKKTVSKNKKGFNNKKKGFKKSSAPPKKKFKRN